MATPKYIRQMEEVENTRPNVWVFIGRKSPEGRKKVDEIKTSIPRQLELCQKWAVDKETTLVSPPVGERVISGRKDYEDREDLNWALAEIAAGRARGIVAWKFDRLARSMSTFAQLFQKLDEVGGDVAVTDVNLDSSTANGRAMIHMMMVMVTWEAEICAERTTEVLDGKANRGEKYNNQTPFGYDTADGFIVPHEMEQRFIKWVQRTYPRVKSIRKLTQQCASMGYYTRAGNPMTRRHVHQALHWKPNPMWEPTPPAPKKEVAS